MAAIPFSLSGADANRQWYLVVLEQGGLPWQMAELGTYSGMVPSSRLFTAAAQALDIAPHGVVPVKLTGYADSATLDWGVRQSGPIVTSDK